MNTMFENHVNRVRFSKGDIAIECRLYDSAMEVPMILFM